MARKSRKVPSSKMNQQLKDYLPFIFFMYLITLVVHFSILYFIYRFVNQIHSRCQCHVVTDTKTGFFNFYVYSVLLIDFIFLIIYFFNPALLLERITSFIAFIWLYKIYNIITYILLFKYLYDIQQLCQCQNIEPNIQFFLKFYLSILFFINIIK